MKYILPIAGVPKGRPRAGRHGVYTPKRTADFEALVKWHLTDQGATMCDPAAPLAVWILFSFKRPQRPSRYPRKGDIDNLAKSILDAANGVLWDDDAQIVILQVFKAWEDADIIEIDVTEFAKLSFVKTAQKVGASDDPL